MAAADGLDGVPRLGGGCAAAAGWVQAWRRRARQRRISEAYDAHGNLLRVDPYRPPAWLPTALEPHWRRLQVALDAPVEPGKERSTLVWVTVLNGFSVAVLVVACLFAASTSGDYPSLVRWLSVGVTACLGVGFLIFVAAPSTAQGARTAWEQRDNSRQRADGQ